LKVVFLVSEKFYQNDEGNIMRANKNFLGPIDKYNFYKILRLPTESLKKK
jgi:hypothetical protein